MAKAALVARASKDLLHHQPRLQTCMASSLWQKLLSCNYPRLDPFKPTDLVPLLDKLTTTATTTIYLPYHIFGGGPYFRWQWGGQAEWQQLLFAWLGMCKL